MPDVASAQEQGLKDFEAYSWNAMFLPKATPAPIVEKLHAATVAAMDTPALQKRLHDLGATVPPPERRSSEYLQKFVEGRDQEMGRGDQGRRIDAGIGAGHRHEEANDAQDDHGRSGRSRWRAAAPAYAQDWPTHPITLVVPFAAGGGVDVSARIQAQRMSEMLGQSIVVENMGGAAGMTGGQRVAKAPPDGYTMLIGNSGTHAYSQALHKKPIYNSVADFTPVGLVSESPRILIARPDMPVKNLQEFVAYVKANQSKMQFGSAGVGSGTHLPCVLLNTAMGVTVTHVPYRGEAPSMQDVIGKRMDYMCATIQTGAAQAKQGSVKGIAVMAPQARGDHAGPCNHDRAGSAGRRSERVECVLPAEGHAGRDREEAQQGDERYAR